MTTAAVLLPTVVLLMVSLAPLNPVNADDVELTEAFLSEPENIALGQELFKQQCARCHGKGAYPGKAPKLRVKKLSAEDIYLRTTYGFRKMPAWEEVFTDEERMAITAYVTSPLFSN